MGRQGAVVPLTHHLNEQVRQITEGVAEVYSQGRKYILKAGDIMIIVPHEFIFLEDTIDIDIFIFARGGKIGSMERRPVYVRNRSLNSPSRH